MISSLAASRLPVGSSASTILGSLMRARAMQTRCCSPPDNCEGRWPARSLRPTRSSAARASRSSVMLWKYWASMTFSTAVRYGIIWNCWKTKPTVEASDEIDQGALAGTGRAYHRDPLALRDGERDVVKRLNQVEPAIIFFRSGGITLGDILESNHSDFPLP